MDEQVTWKGHSFTLLVFAGIVFLCSIFFVLGMLVGRGQGKSAAESAAVYEAVKSAEAVGRTQEMKSTHSPVRKYCDRQGSEQRNQTEGSAGTRTGAEPYARSG